MEALLMTTVALVFLVSVVAMVVIDVARLAGTGRDLDAAAPFRGAAPETGALDEPAIAHEVALRKAA